MTQSADAQPPAEHPPQELALGLDYGHPHSSIIHDYEPTEEQVQQVQAQLQEHMITCCDEATIKRFIRATGGNLLLSVKRLQNTCKWREEVKPENVVCKACAQNPRSHYMHVVGYDTLERPIIYSCLALANNRVYEDNKAHMIQTFEMAVKCMRNSSEQWVWVCDFQGFGLADINPKLAKAFLDISAAHYPERLGMFMIVGAPALFNVLWKAIQRFVDPKTHKKIRFLPFDADPAHLAKHNGHSRLKEEMEKHFDPLTTQWLLDEMLENRSRNKHQLKEKVYSMASIHKCASTGELVHLESQHDIRGTPDLLAAYNSCPSMLEPQGTAAV